MHQKNIGNWEKEKYAINGIKRSLNSNDLFVLIQDHPEFEKKIYGLTEWDDQIEDNEETE